MRDVGLTLQDLPAWADSHDAELDVPMPAPTMPAPVKVVDVKSIDAVKIVPKADVSKEVPKKEQKQDPNGDSGKDAATTKT